MGNRRHPDRSSTRLRRSFALSAVASFGLHTAVVAVAVSFVRPAVLFLAPEPRPYVVELQVAVERPETAPIVEPAPITEIMPQVELPEVITDEPPMIAMELDVSLPAFELEPPAELDPLSDLTDAWSRIPGDLSASNVKPRLAGAIGVGGGSSRGGVGGVEGGTGTAVAASVPAPPTATATASVVAQVAQTAAALIHSPRPAYPALSLRRGEAGTAVVRIQVGADGSVIGVELVESSGFTRLDDAALAGVRSWRFRPATRGGVPIATLFLHRLTFRIAAG